MRPSSQPHRSSPAATVSAKLSARTLASALAAGVTATMVTSLATPAARAAASDAPILTVIPREDLVDGQLVEVSIKNGPPRGMLSLDACVRIGEGLACSDSGRSVRILPSGTFGPVAEKVRSILVTHRGRFDCRDPAVSCLLALRAGESVLATAPLSFRAAAPLESAPTILAYPAEALEDGQTISVRGRGFDVSIHTGVRQCRAGTLDPGACRPGGRPPTTSDTGTLEQDVTVYAGFGTVDDDWVDCTAPGACELVVFSGRADGDPVRTPITFVGPAVPAPHISISPSGALTDGQLLTVSGSGFASNATLSIEQYVVRDGTTPNRWRLLIANGFVASAPAGTFTSQLTVRTTGADGMPLCNNPSAPCLLVAREAQGRYGVAKVPLTFR